MDLETLIVTVFCITDDFVGELGRARRLRQRGPAPILADSEVLTVEIVDGFLGLDTDQGLHAHFGRRFGHLVPALRTVQRTTFLRQAANLWAVKQALWQHLAARTRHDAAIVLIDSLPVPVCRFARAHRCRGFAGLAAFGYDPLVHQTYYGLRLHLWVSWPGVVTAATLAPANDADRAVAPQLLAGLAGWALGDGGYWSPTLRAELARARLALIAPAPRNRMGTVRWPAWLVHVRRRIETVLSQLTERYHAKRVRARDTWHLAARWLRKLASPEPRRDSRGLQLLDGRGHGDGAAVEAGPGGAARRRGAAGGRAGTRARVAVGGDPLDRGEGRAPRGGAAPVGAPGRARPRAARRPGRGGAGAPAGPGARGPRAAPGRRDPAQGTGVFCPGGARPPLEAMIAPIGGHRGAHGVAPIRGMPPIAPSTYRAHAGRRADPGERPARRKRGAASRAEARRVLEASFRARGAVARPTRHVGLQGVARGGSAEATTGGGAAPCPLGLVDRQFRAAGPGGRRAADRGHAAPGRASCARPS